MKNLLVALLFIFSFSFCGEKKPDDFTEEKTLFEYANKLYKDGSYTEAIPFFESLKNRFPQSPLAPQSELKIADATFDKGEYMEAEVLYRNFRTLHPTNEKVPYAVFRMGLSQYKRKPKSVDRDQTEGQSALGTFTEVTQNWPNSKEAQEAKPYIEKCKRALVERELYVGRFYLKHKQYEAAAGRLKPIAEKGEYADLQQEAKSLLSQVKSD